MQRLAHFDRPLEFAPRRQLRQTRPAVGGRPGGEVFRRLQRFRGLGLAAPEARIDELQAEIGAIHRSDLITG